MRHQLPSADQGAHLLSSFELVIVASVKHLNHLYVSGTHIFVGTAMRTNLKFSALRTITTLTVCCSTLLAACGGGGGGGGDTFVGAADVGLSVTPSHIDSGDRAEVSITLSNVIKDGLALKVRFPDALKYVRSSALLLIGEKETDLTPKFNGPGQDSDHYLVFYIPQSAFRKNGQDYNGESGTVVLQLEGIESVTDGMVEVDPDVDDPLQPNDTEFNVEAPQFDAEATAPISVQAN